MIAELVGCANAAKNQDIDTVINFKSFSKHWINVVFRDGAVPSSTHTSLPVPVLRQGQVQIAYMICPFRVIQGPVQMRPPNQVIWCDPVSADITAEAYVSSDYFGQADDPGKNLPEWSFDNFPKSGENSYDNLRKRLFELYDVLFPVWATDSTKIDRVRLQNLTCEFLKIFNQVSEPPLRPYYYSLGNDYFKWLRKLAG